MSYDKPMSYSGLSLWRECPRKWFHRYKEGYYEPPGPAAVRGTEVHSDLELYFAAEEGQEVQMKHHKILTPWLRKLSEFYGLGAEPEGEVAVDSNWKRVAWDSPDAYFRGIIDLRWRDENVVHILDWKTGRIRANHVYQGEAYVALEEDADDYRTHFAYIDHPTIIHTRPYTDSERHAFQQKIGEEIEEVRNARDYPETPGNGCRWCALNWRSGGPCKKAP